MLCDASSLRSSSGASGLTAWLAKADYVVMPVLFLGVALVGFGLYRGHLSRCEHQTRERQVSESKAYDLVVIGSGTAAQVVSFRARAAGWSVAVIDHLPFGGTCALRGCDPKKMLISGAEAIDLARRMRGKGRDRRARDQLAGTHCVQTHLHRSRASQSRKAIR
jgi:hypothetical protein